MALLSKKKFAEKCGITLQHLSEMISRGKVQLSGNHINDTHDLNSLFLQKCALKKIEENERISEIAFEKMVLHDLQSNLDAIPYNPEAEKRIASLINQAERAGCPVFPTALMATILQYSLTGAYESMILREVEIIQESGRRVPESVLQQLVQYYAGECQNRIRAAISDMNNQTEDIKSNPVKHKVGVNSKPSSATKKKKR